MMEKSERKGKDSKEEEKSQAPSWNRTLDLTIMRHMFYHSTTTAASFSELEGQGSLTHTIQSSLGITRMSSRRIGAARCSGPGGNGRVTSVEGVVVR